MWLWQWLVGLMASVFAGLGVGFAPDVAPIRLPDAFADRPALPDCGRVTQYIGQVDAVGPAVDCFDAALAAGGAAELLVEVNGIDSGPVFFYHRALPGAGGLETFLDHRRDHYRSADWQRWLCPEARSLRDTGECEDGQL